jgi:PAS domain S-box-containing protein
MISISGYQVLGKIFEGLNSRVYRAIQLPTNKPVIIKTPQSDYPSLKEIAKLQHECEIAGELDLEGIVKAYAVEKYETGWALVLEDFGGVSLLDMMALQKSDEATFLKIAIQLAQILGQIHRHGVIHKDIKPQNIIVHMETLQVKLTGFGIASRLLQEKQEISYPSLLEGTLAYMSPEQTGRMNRSLDYRTDFYSLGVTFYEMLTGELPFSSNDPLELVHCHITKQPTPPHHKTPVPIALSQIVLKMLSKTSEDRYQSAYGLKSDLEECLVQWQAKGKIAEFRPGQNDISEKFQISQKLYGRESEIEAIMAAFQRASLGTKEIVLVSGYAGIGKSSLIQEIQKTIGRRNGYFIAGKFENLKRSIPYSALFQAFTELIRQILTEPESNIAIWQKKLLHAVGSNGQVLINVVPEMELIIGPQSPVPELGPGESQNRFLLIFRNFIAVFAQAEHPLVIFLDDLQWVDTASLHLLKLSMTDPDAKFLFLIGAYRDNEVDGLHPLLLAMDEFCQEGFSVTRISLCPLRVAHISSLIAETLSCTEARAEAMAEIILKRTQGNAFFAKEFLHTLYQQKLIEFDIARGSWNWSMEKIQNMEITDNVVELMASKLQKLSKNTQDVLKLAACIGNQFELKTLSIVYEKAPATTFFDLWEALREGFILPLADSYKFFQDESLLARNWMQQNPMGNPVFYKFPHDRVRQAAYSLLPEDDRKKIHYRIGKLLWANATPKEMEERLFDIIFHLNFAGEWNTDASERESLSQLNLLAGKKAKSSTAYTAATKYLATGIEFLPQAKWEKHYELTFALYMELAQCEYLHGDFGKAENFFEILLKEARKKTDKAKVYDTKIILYTNLGKYKEAVALGIDALRELQVSLPLSPGAPSILWELWQVRRHLGHWKNKDLLHLPEMKDLEKLAAMNLLKDLIPPAYFTSAQNLFALVILKMLKMSFLWGNAAVSFMGYAGYGVILCSKIKDYRAGYKFGKLAITLSEKFNNTAFLGESYYIFAALINIWSDDVRTSIPLAEKAYKILVESGNLIHAGYAMSAHLFNMCIAGYPLAEIHEKVHKYLAFLTKIKDCDRADYFVVVRQKIQSLEKITGDPASFSNNGYEEERHIAEMREKNDLTPLHWYYLNKMEVLYLFEKYAQALEIAKKSQTLVEQGVFLGTLQVPEHYFYHSLILTALYAEASARERKEYLALLKRNQKKMRGWKQHCPHNFLHQYLLVEAEIKRVLKQHIEAGELYERAILAAAEQGNSKNLALAHELAAKFFLAKGLDIMARGHMEQSRYFYLYWGAKAKAQWLQNKYPQLFKYLEYTEKPHALVAENDSLLTSSREDVVLDLHTVVKASQAISEEIVLEKLLARLIGIMMENAGAQRGVLILIREYHLSIEVEKAVDKKATIARTATLEDNKNLPQTIINYVKRTGASIVLPNACKENIFSNDPYVIENEAKSILCTAIFKHAKLMGILYLENNLITSAFTSQRLQILESLSSQAAISLENAWLYEEMKQAREEIKKREEYFRSLIENALDIIIILESDGIVCYTSPSVVKVLGYQTKEMDGKSCFSFVHQDDLLAAKNIYETILRNPFRSHSIELRCQHKNGYSKLLECIAQTMAGSLQNPRVIVNARDITERKEAESALRESEERYRTLIESSPDAILVEQDGYIAYINPAGLKLLGYACVTELQGYSLQNIFVSQEGVDRDMWSSSHALREGKFYHKNKNLVDVEMICIETFYQQKSALEVIARDVTETKALRTKAQKMQQLAALGQLSATIAHEIRNPLSSISLNFQHLSEHLSIPQNYQNAFHNIGHGILRIQKVVEGILNFARPLQSNLKKINIHKILDSSLRYVERELEEKQIKVVKEYDTLPTDVFVDPTQLSEVFVNLFTNAKQAMLHGGELRLLTRVCEDGIEVRISDTGEGISAENLEKLFTPFFTTRRDGTGLGLAIVAKILEQHQASIKVDSKIGLGTTFAIKFFRSL